MREIKHGAGFVYRLTVGEHLLVALHNRSQTDPIFALTPTGAELWNLMHDWTTSEQLVGHLTSRFEVDGPQASADVAEFLAQLGSIGALEERES